MVPDTGLIKLIPKETFFLEVLFPFILLVVPVVATVTFGVSFTGSTYSFDTIVSFVSKVFNSFAYFSAIAKFSLLVLFFSFNSFTACSASSKVDV